MSMNDYQLVLSLFTAAGGKLRYRDRNPFSVTVLRSAPRCLNYAIPDEDWSKPVKFRDFENQCFRDIGPKKLKGEAVFRGCRLF
jgi:hypothetical protein